MDKQFKKRHIRVFISSTFRDMQEERDLLVKRIFPELRKRCRQREVEFTEVDLRWGVTEEQAERGEALPICLREIENTRPYFICLLGDRYGWVPPGEMIGPELIDLQPWLAEHREKSVTELEIIHGVLANPKMNDRAFFYFRDHSYAEKVDRARVSDFIETDPGQIRKLNRLKQKIHDSGCKVRENYSDPHEAAACILEDLWTVIDKEFPEGSKPEPLDRELTEHEQYADTRRRVYIGREEYFLKLDEHVSSKNPPLVITGESGSGKSALVANWVERYRRHHPDAFIIQHYAGSSPRSANHIMIIKRIIQEISRRFLLTVEMPAEPGELKKAFPQWLKMAAQRGGMILVLDGLDQIEDTDNALELYWLPTTFPDSIRVIISALPGKVMDVLKKRGWPQFSVNPLREDERSRLINGYLSRYRKSLDEKQLNTLARSKQTGNPLFLKVLLDELRVFGIYEQLNELMIDYLNAEDPARLYGKILVRLEKDYEKTCPGLVRDALSLLWASRRGLSEAELLDMMGVDGDPLPQAVWSPLFLAIEESLIMREGLLNFFHTYLREAVYARYIRNADSETFLHKEIADYFIRNETDYRKADELPWQLTQTHDWEKLADAMRDPGLLTEIWDRNEYEAKEYWTLIEQNTGISPAVAFRELVEESGEYEPGTYAVTNLLNDLGYVEEAFKLLNYMAGQLDEESGLIRIIRNKQATILRDWGRIDEAMTMYRKNEEDARKEGNESDMQTSLSNQALLLGMQGRLEEAFGQYRELEKKARISGDKYQLAVALTNEGRILHDFGRSDEALGVLNEAEQLVRELGYRDEVNLIHQNKAAILKDLGKTEEAFTLLQQAERSHRQTGDREGLAINLTAQANLLEKEGKLEKALDYFKRSEELFRQLGNRANLSINLACQAKITNELGGRNKAMEVYREAEEVFRELGDRDSLAVCLKDQGLLLFDMNKLEEALGLFRESERLFREIGNIFDLRFILSGLVLLLKEMNREEELPDMYKELEELCSKMGETDALLEHLGEHAELMNRLERHAEALQLFQQQEELIRNTDNTKSLGPNLGNQGLTLSSMDRFEEAVGLHVMSGEVFEEQGNMIGLSISYANRGLLYRELGQHKNALMMHEKEEALCRKTKYTDGLMRSLGYQALALYELKQYKQALKFFREQERVAKKEKAGIAEIFTGARENIEKEMNK